MYVCRFIALRIVGVISYFMWFSAVEHLNCFLCFAMSCFQAELINKSFLINPDLAVVL